MNLFIFKAERSTDECDQLEFDNSDAESIENSQSNSKKISKTLYAITRRQDVTQSQKPSLQRSKRNVEFNDSVNEENVVSFIAAMIARHFSRHFDFLIFKGRRIHRQGQCNGNNNERRH